MNELFIYLFLTGVIMILLGVFIGNLWSKNKFSISESGLKSQKERLETDLSHAQVEINDLKNQLQLASENKQNLLISLTQKESSLQHIENKLVEQKSEVEKLQEKFTKEFENLANKILEEKSNKFTEQNKENLKLILNPLNEKILHFEQKVEQTHKESIDYHAAFVNKLLG